MDGADLDLTLLGLPGCSPGGRTTLRAILAWLAAAPSPGACRAMPGSLSAAWCLHAILPGQPVVTWPISAALPARPAVPRPAPSPLRILPAPYGDAPPASLPALIPRRAPPAAIWLPQGAFPADAFTDPAQDFDEPLTAPGRPVSRGGGALWWLLAAVAVVAIAGAIVMRIGQPSTVRPIEGSVVGADVAVAAPASGRIGVVLVVPGQRVSRGSALFEMQPGGAGGGDANTAERLAAARSRQAALARQAQDLASALARLRATPGKVSPAETEAARQRARDAQTQAAAAGEEVADLETAAAVEAALAAGKPARVQADRVAVVAQVRVAEGAFVTRGNTLAILVDCANLSVSLDGAPAGLVPSLVPGQALQVVLSNGTPVTARVPAAGVNQGGAVLLPIDAGQFLKAGDEACPVGLRASIRGQ